MLKVLGLSSGCVAPKSKTLPSQSISSNSDPHADLRSVSGRATMISSLYQELDQAEKESRLILIQPGHKTDAIRCSMRTFSLLERPLPKYETISYVWGDATLRSTVHVNHEKFGIPSSAAAVLRRMRDTQCERIVWIDSLCIDQTSTNDRSYQVRLMCDIYSSATTNLIWLGEDDGHAEEIFESIRALYEEARLKTSDFQTFKETVWPGWWDAYGPPSAVQFNPELLGGFFNLPWFSRLWVVQEAVLAPRSVCYYGSHKIPLILVQRVAIWLYSKSKSSQSLLSGHSGLARAVHLASYADELFETPFRTENNLLWMLNTLKQYNTSREEDHVYGLVGMYQQFLLRDQALPKRLIPDYGRPLRYVFCNATKLAIEELQSLDPLLYVCHRKAEEIENDPLPTWVPKWHRQQDLEIDHFPLNYSKFRASQDAKPCTQPAEMDCLGSLIVHGFHLDDVKSLTDAFSHAALYTNALLLGLLKSAEGLLADTADTPGQLEHTLVASLDHRMAPMSKEQSRRGYRALTKHLAGGKSSPSFNEAEHNDGVNGYKAYHEALVRWMRNRRFFVTKLGYIGTAPNIMQRGDLVTVIYGSRMPIILRQLQQNELYAVIGQAYVFGNMFGEAVEAQNTVGAKDRSFILV